MSTDEPSAPPAASSQPSAAPIPVDEWLDRVRAGLQPAGLRPAGLQSGDLTLTTTERRLLLDLARIAAHHSERITAPLSTYLAGIALAGLAPDARGERLAHLVRDLEAGLG